MTETPLIRQIVSRPALSFIITLAIILVSAFLAAQVTKNTTPYFLDRTHTERVKEDLMTDIFERSRETIVIILEAKSGDIFSAESLSLLETIHKTLDSVDLIEMINPKLNTGKSLDKASLISQYNQSLAAAKNEQESKEIEALLGQYLFPIRNIKSLLNSDDIFMLEDEITIAPNFEQEKIAQWQQNQGKEILDNPLFTDALVSPDGRAMAINLELNIDTDDSASTTAIFNKVQGLIKPIVESSNFDLYFSGSPVVNVEISNVMEKDNQRYFPLIVLLIALTLAYLFRSAWAPFFALSVSIISIVITFGLMTLLGISLNIVTTMLPIFIITIGVTDAIHVLSESKLDQNKTSKQEATIAKVSKLFRAMLLTSLTTALGFFSLSYTEITNIKEFGIMVGISAIVAFIISVTVLPTLMANINFSSGTTQRPIRFFEALENIAKKQTISRCFALLFLLVVFSLIGLPNFYVDQQNLHSFKAQTQLRQDDARINELLGGTVPVNVWISSDEQNGILSPEVLRVIEKLEAQAKRHDAVGYTSSISGFIKQLHKTLSPNDDKIQSSELSPELISQYLFLLEGGPSRDLESIAKVGPYNETRVVIMSKTDGSKQLQQLLDDLGPIAETLPEGVSFRFTGYGSMNAAASKEIIQGQLSSIIISVVGLLLVLCTIYRSIRIGIIAIFPLSMSLLVMFGLMGLLQIPLDIGSSLLCGIAFGIGIDYSIHIVEAYLRNLKALQSRDAAAQAALTDITFPILTSAFTIALGFSILLLSEFQPIFNLGLLISITMLVSALC
ncbi:RND family transporter, partial [Oleiphilus sp. HI0123]